MSRTSVKLLVFAGCPLAASARDALEQALAECGLAAYEETDLLAPETPEELRGCGLPTILIDGKDVTGEPKGHDFACRVYSGPTKLPENRGDRCSPQVRWTRGLTGAFTLQARAGVLRTRPYRSRRERNAP